MLQLGFDFSGPIVTAAEPWTGPVCMFGRPSPVDPEWSGPHHCPACAADVERACRAFDEAVARGEYDENGYTPAEAKAARKRGTYRAWR